MLGTKALQILSADPSVVLKLATVPELIAPNRVVTLVGADFWARRSEKFPDSIELSFPNADRY